MHRYIRSLGVLMRSRRGGHLTALLLINDVRSVTCEWMFCAGLGDIWIHTATKHWGLSIVYIQLQNEKLHVCFIAKYSLYILMVWSFTIRIIRNYIVQENFSNTETSSDTWTHHLAPKDSSHLMCQLCFYPIYCIDLSCSESFDAVCIQSRAYYTHQRRVFTCIPCAV